MRMIIFLAETNMFEMTRSVSLAPAETDRTQEEDTRNSIRKNMKLHSQALGMAQAMVNSFFERKQ